MKICCRKKDRLKCDATKLPIVPAGWNTRVMTSGIGMMGTFGGCWVRGKRF